MAVVVFSDSNPLLSQKFLSPDPGPKNFQIWEYDSCSDLGYHRRNRNSAFFYLRYATLFLLKKCLYTKTTLTRADENEKWLRFPDPVFHKFLTPAPGSKENAESCRSRLRHPGCVATSGVGPSDTLKNWVIGFVFSITTRSASVSAVALFRLLEPLSYARFDILKLMQVILLLIHRYPDYFEKKKKLTLKLTLLTKLLSSCYKLVLLIDEDLCLVQR